MKEKFTVFIDIDGTLTDYSGVNPKNAKIIEQVRKLGHYVFINTGRPRNRINSKLLGNIEFDGIISGLGSQIELNGKPIFEKYIDNDFVYSCAKHFWNTKNCFYIGGAEKQFVLNPIDAFYDTVFADFNSPEDFKGIYKNEKIQKIELFGEINQDDAQFIEKELDAYVQKTYVEGRPKGCTKYFAMNIVNEHLGIDKSHSIAIGDSINDSDMLKNAGIAVVMGNARDNVKEMADFVSTDCIDGGVAYALEKLLLQDEYKHFV